MKRGIALILLSAGLLVPIWVRSPIPDTKPATTLTFRREALPAPQRLADAIAPFRLEEAWQLQSPSAGGYSALVPLGPRRFLALSDDGRWLWLDLEHGMQALHAFGKVRFSDDLQGKAYHDVESATRDPATGQIWLGLEGWNAIVRTDASLTEHARVKPAAMDHWGENSGPEALLRLTDGRFITVREIALQGGEGRLHEALLFTGDPTSHPQGIPFVFEGPRNFSVVDMAQMPDGRVLILMRRLIWVMPLRFAGRIVIADPRQIGKDKVWKAREVAPLVSDMPIDNFEGMAVTQGSGGKINVWLISDDNFMTHWQRTLLWHLSVDPARLH